MGKLAKEDEEPLDVLRLDSYACVLHTSPEYLNILLQRYMTTTLWQVHYRYLHLDMAQKCELYCVSQQVKENLLESLLVKLNLRGYSL